MSKRIAAKAAFVAAFMVSSIGMVWSGAALAAGGVKCNGVFPGGTPHLIDKTADKQEAYAGQQVTYTISFNSQTTGKADVRDCFRVDNGSNAALNALVTGLDVSVSHQNTGPKGTLQVVTVTITIPSDPSLYTHKLVDRAKVTHGSKESKSSLVETTIIAPPGSPGCTTDCPCTTNCGGSTTPPTTVQGKQVHKSVKHSVKGGSLAHTGPVSAKAMFLGSLMLMIGLTTRIRRPRFTPVAQAADNSGSSYLARYDRYIEAKQKH